VHGHGRDGGVAVVSELGHRDLLTLEVPDGANPLGPEQLVAARMHPSEDDEGLARLEVEDQRGGRIRPEVRLARAQHLPGAEGPFQRNVLYVGEPFGVQQLLGNVQGSEADARLTDQSDPCRLWRGLRGGRLGMEAVEPRRSGQRGAAQESPTNHAFNSLFSSLMKRHSTPWAMIFCGLDLIIPASCRRRA
jgi:hypothetical protein